MMTSRPTLKDWRAKLESQGHRVIEPTWETATGFTIRPNPDTTVAIGVELDEALHSRRKLNATPSRFSVSWAARNRTGAAGWSWSRNSHPATGKTFWQAQVHGCFLDWSVSVTSSSGRIRG